MRSSGLLLTNGSLLVRTVLPQLQERIPKKDMFPNHVVILAVLPLEPIECHLAFAFQILWRPRDSELAESNPLTHTRGCNH